MNRQDFFRLARNRALITPDAELDPRAIDKTGSTLNILTAVASTMAEEVDARSQARHAALLVASATGADLDRLILELSKGRLPRKGASAATIDLQVSRPTAAAGEGTIPAGTEILAGGLTWTLDVTVIFAAAQTLGGAATATCATLGSAGNGVAADVHAFKVPGALFDPTAVVQSSATTLDGTASSSGGQDAENDEAYRARYALWDAGLDRNVDFLAAGALSVPGVAAATAIEDLDTPGDPTGTVTLYVGDVFGRATLGLLARVSAAARGFRMLGQHVRIFQTLPSYRSFELRFGVLDGFAVADVRAAVVVALVAYVNRLAPGAALLRAGLSAVIQSVPGVVLLEEAPFGLTPGSPGDVDLFPTLKSTTYRTKRELVGFS